MWSFGRLGKLRGPGTSCTLRLCPGHTGGETQEWPVTTCVIQVHGSLIVTGVVHKMNKNMPERNSTLQRYSSCSRARTLTVLLDPKLEGSLELLAQILEPMHIY